jgi:DNA-binding GntR family transcriptional regulator
MQIERDDLSTEVYKRLKDMILADELKQGEKLRQEKIAALFGISRMPLHKAFQMLENEMLVENRPRKGFYVTTVTEQRLIDAFEVREVLEGLAVRRVTEIISEEQIRRLKSLFQPFIGKDHIDLKKYSKADQEFHDTMIRICDNQILRRLEIIVNVTLMTYRGGLIRQPEETLPEHLAIIEAVEKGDAKKAESMIRKHSRKTCRVLKDDLKKQTPNPLTASNHA